MYQQKEDRRQLTDVLETLLTVQEENYKDLTLSNVTLFQDQLNALTLR